MTSFALSQFVTKINFHKYTYSFISPNMMHCGHDRFTEGSARRTVLLVWFFRLPLRGLFKFPAKGGFRDEMDSTGF
ncbi:hypothetical protein XI25_27690 [Paenibacillus sp. DMB20]|nr:hypothetical protein XI25_27690 [Paenibacillus sp. DMB20]